MNVNQIITMLTRLVMRRAMNWGMSKGLGQMSRKSPPGQVSQTRVGKPGGGQPANHQPGGKKQAGDLAKRMRSLGRMTRR